LIAARTNDVDDSAISNESYIESYTRGISQVESVLALDRLRQEVAIKEMLNRGLQQTATLLNMKRATSLPNAINHNSVCAILFTNRAVFPE
jgi:kinesin family protein 13